MTSRDIAHQLRRLEPMGGRFAASWHMRCECRRCHSHLMGVARDGVVSGVCGGTDLTPEIDDR